MSYEENPDNMTPREAADELCRMTHADDRRERYAAAMWPYVAGKSAHVDEAADAAMAVADEEMLTLQRELTSAKSAHRAVWDKHQKRGQWIFDLQGKNARLRAELSYWKAKLTAVTGGRDDLRHETARLRAELEAADLRAQRGMEDLMRERTTLRSTIARVRSVLDEMGEDESASTIVHYVRAALGKAEGEQ